MRHLFRTSSLLLGLLLIGLPTVASAQQASGIAGIVRDTSGAVLPGVTVEASSPALIEKVRSVVTDGEGRYNIVDLRIGTYTVTFALAGFNTLRREGIQLTAGFTAAINVEMQVGSLQETVTVTGASPLVDTQNVRQQRVVSSDLLDALPTSSRALVNLINLTPGYQSASIDVGGSLGTYRSMQPGGTFHGKTGFKVLFDGMRTNNMEGSGSQGYIPNAVLVEETTLETGGVSAESAASGTLTNMVPKEGGNSFRATVAGMFTDDSLQSNNLTSDLRAQGLTTVDKILNMHDASGTLGGRIVRDKLWFFTGHRRWGNRNQIAGVFWNATQGTPFYTPDPDRPADRLEYYQSHAFRFTWQASPRNKVKQVRHRRGCFREPPAVDRAGPQTDRVDHLALAPRSIQRPREDDIAGQGVVAALHAMDPRVDAPVDHHGRRINIERGQDGQVRGPLDVGGPFADLALNLGVVHGPAAGRAAHRALGAGDQPLHRVRQGLAVVGHRDHDGH